jgi:hypothetical protein
VNALVFTWFQPDWPIKFTWMGPDARVRAIAKIRPESVAAVIAPASIGGAGSDLDTRIAFAFGNASPVMIGTVPTGRYLAEIRVDISQAFDGTGASISIGEIGSPEKYVRADASLISETGIYEHPLSVLMSAANDVFLFITPGVGATTGQGQIILNIV